MTYSQTYYDEIRGRLRAVLFVVAELLPQSTFEFVSEWLDANELGLALQTIVEVLAEASAPVTRQTVADLADLAIAMQMDYDVEETLARCIVDEGSA